MQARNERSLRTNVPHNAKPHCGDIICLSDNIATAWLSLVSWFVSVSCARPSLAYGVLWQFDTPVEEDMVLTAQWAAIPPPATQYSIALGSLDGVETSKAAGVHPVNEGGAFSFSATATDGASTVIVYVDGVELVPYYDDLYFIDGITKDLSITFALSTVGKVGDGNLVGSIEINGEPLDGKKVDYPTSGEIVITFDGDVDVDKDSGKVTVDSKEVNGTWGVDNYGNSTYTFNYYVDGDGEHTIVIEGFGGNGEKYTFITGGGNGATSNDILSATKISASVGAITIDTQKAAVVQVVSFTGHVVYNAEVIGTTTVNVPVGIYAVVVDGTTTKVVVR